MLLMYVSLLFTAAVVSGYQIRDENYYLSWPEKYTLKAIRNYISLNIVENSQMWRTNISSRIDYNDGTVKSIRKKEFLNYAYGVQYEIHPEFTSEATNIVSINVVIPVDAFPELETVLPKVDNFQFIGHESINDKETLMFCSKTSVNGSEFRKSVWAVLDNATDVWIPIRYEVMKYNEWLGYLDNHLIVDFYGFATDFDESVFNIAETQLQNGHTEHTMDSESVTKHLMFIDPEHGEHVDHVFSVFKSEHNKEYEDENEHNMRKSIFQNKMRLIKSTNYKNLGYKLAVNEFSDRTPEEMQKYKGLLKNSGEQSGNAPFPYTVSQIREMEAELPDEHDLRMLGYVSSVKNQGSCGSCWAFCTTAVMEGALARHNGGKLFSLSHQALIDCGWPFGTLGCNGGSVSAAFEWMLHYGLPTEMDYGSYLMKEDYCRITNMTVKYPIESYTDVMPEDIGALKVVLVNHGPVAVSVHASPAFEQYSGGVFYDINCSINSINHGVTLVGYGMRDGETYWILKNSWGPNWGVDGYMLISTRDNNCGVTSGPAFVNL